MRNKIQSAIPFLTNKITNLLRAKWISQADRMREGDILAKISSVISDIITNINAGSFIPQYLQKWSLPIKEDLLKSHREIQTDLNNITTEGLVIGNFVLSTENLVRSSIQGLIGKSMYLLAMLNTTDHNRHSSYTLAFVDQLENLSLADSIHTKSVAITNGHLTLARDSSLDPIANNIASVYVESQGDPGNVREVYVPTYNVRDIANNDDIGIDADTSSSDGVSIEQRGTVQYYSEIEQSSSDPMTMFADDAFFEVACCDLQEYTVPVKILHPFTIYSDPEENIPLIWGEALLRVPEEEKDIDVNIFRYTSAPDYEGQYPEYGYGWTYLSRDISKTTTWIGQPKDRAVVDINGEMGKADPPRDNNNLTATVLLNLSRFISISGLTFRLAPLSGGGGRGKSFLPYIDYVQLMDKNSEWDTVGETLYASSTGEVKVSFPKRDVYGIRVNFIQEWPYETQIGHPYILQEITVNPVKQKERSYPAAVLNDYLFIIRLPMNDEKRQDMPILDYDGRIGKVLVFDDPNMKRAVDVLKLEDTTVKLVYGDDVFDANRWAIRIDRIMASQDTYKDSGEYMTIPISSVTPIKSVWVDAQQHVPDDGSDINYSIIVSGHSSPLLISPENIASRSDSSSITRYVFDPSRDTGNFTKYVETEESVHSLQLQINLKRGSDITMTPSIDFYAVYIEV